MPCGKNVQQGLNHQLGRPHARRERQEHPSLHREGRPVLIRAEICEIEPFASVAGIPAPSGLFEASTVAESSLLKLTARKRPGLSITISTKVSD